MIFDIWAFFCTRNSINKNVKSVVSFNFNSYNIKFLNLVVALSEDLKNHCFLSYKVSSLTFSWQILFAFVKIIQFLMNQRSEKLFLKYIDMFSKCQTFPRNSREMCEIFSSNKWTSNLQYLLKGTLKLDKLHFLQLNRKLLLTHWHFP